MTDPSEPLQRDELVDKPGIVGARWWQDGLAGADPMARRTALKVLFGATVGVAAVGGLVALLARKSSGSSVSYGSVDDYDTSQTRAALAMQREYGWNFGASGEPLVWDGDTSMPFSRAALATLVSDLSPSSSSYRPFFVPTLLESVTAQRKTVPPADPGTFVPVQEVLMPIFTTAMGVAFRTGRALASLFDRTKMPDAPQQVALVVDLPGPESIAFAAGAAGMFDPVMLMDNWPHPRGVVRSHLALAAAAYFQPLFAKARATRKKSPPMFILDRGRLASYTDDSTHFDNRFVAKLPSYARVKGEQLAHVLYVAPTSRDTLEMDDLNDDFVAMVAYGINVNMVAADSFGPDPASGASAPVTTPAPFPTPPPGSASDAGAHDAGARLDVSSPIPNPDTPLHYYGRSVATHPWFWTDYRTMGIYSQIATAREPDFPRPASGYGPSARKSPFSNGLGSPQHPTPTEFGTIPVIVAVGTGVVVGAAMSRSGSWTRASGWGGS